MALSAAAHAAPARWSLIIYSGVDEEEIASYTDPLVKELQAMELPAGVELLLQNDTDKPDGATRVIRRENRANEVTELPEPDSASQETFGAFLDWAKHEAHGENRMLVVMTHSWGWKGLIQDYTVPGRPGADTMMPLRDFARLVRESGLEPQVLFLDSCVLGTVEAIDELKGASRYIVASQQEMPYAGFPYAKLFELLRAPAIGPRELAAAIPPIYVQAYARGGERVAAEGEHNLVTGVALDMDRWGGFVEAARSWVAALSQAGAREALEADDSWTQKLWDGEGDAYADLVSVLDRVSWWVGEQTRGGDVLSQTHALQGLIGYPRDTIIAAEQVIELKDARGVDLRIPADPAIQADDKELLKRLVHRWTEANEDLDGLGKAKFSIESRRDGKYLHVRQEKLGGYVAFRPWLPGVLEAEATWVDGDGREQRGHWTRASDVTIVREFPASSPWLAEAHTQGAPLAHGLSIQLKPRMDANEERAQDAESGLSGPAFYRTLQWNRDTGWGDLTLLK